MARPDYGEGGGFEAWKRLQDLGAAPQGQIPEDIARSWERCAAINLSLKVSAEPMSQARLLERREASERLRLLVQPELDALAPEIELDRCVILLSDANGVVLDSIGSTGFSRKAERVALLPGVQWSEDGLGTNAIGTAITECKPVEVRGAEHYLPRNHILHCAAAPLLSPQGELLGVLDISGDARERHVHSMGLVRWAVQMVERRIALDFRPGQELIRFHTNPSLVGSHREGLVIVEDGRIVGATPKAIALLGSNWSELLGTSPDDLFTKKVSRSGGEALKTANGLTFYGRCEGGKTVARAPASQARVPPQSAAAGPDDPSLEPILDRAKRVLDAGMSVLVLGETGVGKEHLARRIHALSARRAGPFVAVNCGALPESLIDSELFGYEEGAFTGARRKGMPGRVREANGGVLFLDEIGDMPLGLQARLLRVLQERQVTPLGGRPSPVDFSLICATHRDLRQLVAEGAFRADLFYRLQDFCVPLPALRERLDRADLIRRLFRAHGGYAAGLELGEEVFEALMRYSWPGNIRELVSALRGMIALTQPGTRLEPADLPPQIREETGAGSDSALTRSIALTEAMIAEAFKAANGCVTEAARLLGVHRSTLYRRLPKSS